MSLWHLLNTPATPVRVIKLHNPREARLDALLDHMRDLSRQAAEQILASRGRPFHGPQRPRPNRRSAS